VTATLRCVVVEDEPEARANLVSYLRQDPGVEIVGEAADGPAAVARIDSLLPDVVVLDVQIPDLDGVGVLRRIASRPEVIFTTAYEGYAVTAFELGALDYLVKPFGSERLLAAIQRVRSRIAPAGGAPSAVERALATTSSPLTRLFARKGPRIVPIAVGDIVRIEACEEYSRVHTRGDSYLVHVALKELLAQLDPDRFEQIHRSHVISLDAIDHMSSVDDRRLLVTLRDGARIVASRSGSERLRRLVR
jgi:two-component system, LytTR family, response regulator